MLLSNTFTLAPTPSARRPLPKTPGDGQRQIDGVGTLADANASQLAFLSNRKYLTQAIDGNRQQLDFVPILDLGHALLQKGRDAPDGFAKKYPAVIGTVMACLAVFIVSVVLMLFKVI